MALIKCIECGQEISTMSDVCIHCGCPVKKDVEQVPISNNVSEPPKKKKGKTFILICVILLLLIAGIYIFNYMSLVEIPSLYGVSEENASLILTSNSLIPNFVYEYNDCEEGLVFETFPYSYERVSKNSSVTVYVSKGPSFIQSTESTIEWFHVGTKEDNWEFFNPYIKEGYLYIECKPTFATSFNWKDEGFGTASINDTFSKTVPVSIKYTNKDVAANQEQSITLVIPVKDLDVNKPTTLYTKLFIEKDNKYQDINVNFSISW